MHSRFSGSLLAACAASTLACAAPAHAQAEDAFSITLPAQPLATSLREVSTRTGVGIVVSAERVRGLRAPALDGAMSAEQAVGALLAGTGLTVRRVGDALVVVDERGGGERRDAPEEDQAPIVVTGTNLREAPASSPVLVLTREDIARSGVTSLEQLMRKLPQNTQGGVNQENFEVSLPGQDVSDHGAGLNLRGLGQRATLVLLNGRRLAPSGTGAFVDISLIPVSLVERVEILTDGASAVYGSDAVGGVVNFILRDRIDGLESTLQAGTATRGGGTQLLASQAVGTSWESGRALLAYEYRREDEIVAGQRPFPVAYEPGNFLLPRERRHSVLADGEQLLAPGLTLSATGTYAHRATDRTYFDAVSPIPIDAAAKADAATASGELAYEFAGGWRVRLGGTYALSDTDERQVQPGGLELANARAVRNEIFGGSLRADGALFALPGGAVRIALGGELRHEAYRDLFESSALAPLLREQARSVRSLSGELSVPLVSDVNRVPGIARLEISAAGRFDDYGGTGSTFDPKLGGVWSPFSGLSLRASYGTSYRAPLLAEIGGNYTVILAPATFVYRDPAAAPAGAIAAILQGSNPALQPETSTTWSAGADIEPAFAPGLSLALTYYSIKFADRIALPTRLLAVVGDPAFEPIIDHSPDVAELTRLIGGSQLVIDATGPGLSDGGATPADVDILVDTRVNNTARTRTDGIDVTLRYAFARGANRFTLDADLNHVFAFDDRLTSASPLVEGLDRLYGPLSWRARGGAAWSRGPWTGTVHANYAGSYKDDRGVSPVPIASYTTVDASLSYTFAETGPVLLRGAQVTVFAENLFDAAPPRVLPDAGSARGLGYDPVNASARGRFVSLQLRKAW